jgi:predicted ribosomally synthesized peptide with SipW-like signal peptide
VCLVSSCVSYQGCANQSVVCPSNNDTCTFSGCVEDLSKPCKIEKLKCAAVLDTAVIAATTAAISAALIAGIICAVVLLGGVAGGATFAYYQSQDDSGMANVTNNPLFVDTGTTGNNALFRV